MLTEIDSARATFHAAINQFNCLKNYASGALLTVSHKRELYSIVITWIKTHLSEKDKRTILQALPHNKDRILQLNEVKIAKIFAILEQVLKKHNLLWSMLSDIQFLIEESAQRLNNFLEEAQVEPSGAERLSIQQTLQQERYNFLTTTKAMLKQVFETAELALQQELLRIYIETIERHFSYWQESGLFSAVLDNLETSIDLQHFDLSHMDLRGIRLHHSNLSYCRLAGCLLMGTGVSAAQLSRAIGFSQAIGLTESLIAEAQVIQYKNWQSRLKKRSDSLDALQAIVAQVEPKPEQEESQDSNYFDSALKRCELLTRYKATLDEHVSAQAIENLLLADLTSEQRHIIEETLADSEKKEASLKEVLNVALNEARWVLFEAYFKKIESLEKENLAEALRHLDHVLVLRVPEKGDATFPKELDDRIAAIKERLLFLELASITKSLMNTEKAGADILHHVYAVLKKPPQPAISSEFKEVIKTAQQNCTKKDIQFHLKHNDFQAAEEILTQFYSDIEIVRRSSVFKEEDFFALEYDLRLQIIERYIGQNNLEEARNKMKALLAQTKVRKYILDLRGRAGFDNAAFWKGIYLQNIAIHLNESQYQALSLSQRQYYNEPLFRAIEKGDAAAVQHGVEFLSWDVDLSNEAGRMPIISACWYGHLDIAQYLFKKGGQIVKIERVGENVNPLNGLIDLKYHEDKARYKPIILWLIENGLEFEPKHALILDEKELFEKSFEQFPSGAIRKQKIRDFLETAVKEGAEVAVLWMLEEQKECVASFPKVESKLPFFSLFNDGPINSKKQPSLLHIACIKGQVSIVEILSSAKELDVPGSHANKQSALHYLTQLFSEYYPGAGSTNETFDEFNQLYAKWRAIAQILCHQGAKHTLYTRLILDQEIADLPQYVKRENINKPCDSDGNMPLHIAVKTQNVLLIQFLLQQNARVNIVNKKGESPLYLACELGNIEIVQVLLDAGASPDGPGRDFTDSEKEHLSVLKLTLAQFKAPLDKKPLLSPKHNPLHCAILREHTIIIQRLCQAGADLEEKYDGKTALHWAVQTENQKSVAILLQHGAKISEPNNEGQTPKQLAAKMGNVAVMMLLTTADIEQSLVCNDRVKARYLNALGEWARGEKSSVSMESSTNSSASSPTLSSSSLSLLTPVQKESLGSTFVPVFEQYLSPHDGRIVLEPIDDDSAEDEVLAPPESSEPVFYSPSNSPGNTG